MAIAVEAWTPTVRRSGPLARLFDWKPFLILICMLPCAALLLTFLTYPLGLGVWLAFTDAQIGQPGEFVGLFNYQMLWEDNVFWLVVFNTIFYTTVATIGKFALGLWLALLLNNSLPFKSFIRAIAPMRALRRAADPSFADRHHLGRTPDRRPYQSRDRHHGALCRTLGRCRQGRARQSEKLDLIRVTQYD